MKSNDEMVAPQIIEMGGEVMTKEIFSGAPVWVWPLLVALLVLGFKASKRRRTSVIWFYLTPFLGLISIKGVASLSSPAIAWACFGAAYLLAAVGARSLQGKWLIERNGMSVTLSGEWFTMLVLMTIFWVSFAAGLMKAIDAEFYSEPATVAVFALVSGAAAGSFLGRTIKILGCVRNM